ncbi:sulfate/molybdate ABC transporter ATP-binding protein [Halpernia frigidisoli]|uniref:ABC-type Fe3+/spermidine/putrescine transport systems, ATPase components n=1 Tax=Halpernia frigidisoli TaxID=1125876 RepID=A0A1I3EDF8_9FLAO|nr:ABC transporter ATP-binding protein [Halpernia frigidisoli]SFH96731.1 ABC-type Fe3+/spermidine/putrescine transport systems, ATPase components [Halpernia frigidisoli]
MLLEIKNLHFSHNENQKLFQNFNLKIDEGRIVALAGESGCGKSTLLNLIYGLLQWESGEIILDNENLYGPKKNIVPGETDIKMVAQTYDLMPYATVAENVGKFLSNINLEKKKEKVIQLLEVVGMENFADILPKNLSGGQQQRVAIARSLSQMPKLLLLDEPFSSLDYSRKIELRERLFKYVKENGLSLIISTHDIQEIMPWTDRLIILKDGRLIQSDSIKETYENPYTDYVAKLFGEVNIFSDEEKNHLNLSKNFYFPHQINITESGLEAKVLESRFAGSYFWNKINFKGKNLVVYSEQELSGNVYLEFV